MIVSEETSAGAGREGASDGLAVTACDFVIVSAVFDEAAVLRALPPGLRPSPSLSGGIKIYQAAEGDPRIAPYTSGMVWLDLDQPGLHPGSAARTIVAGFYSNKAATLIGSHNIRVTEGWSRLSNRSDNTICAETGRETGVLIRLVISPANAPTSVSRGIDTYIGIDPGGSFTRTPVRHVFPQTPARIDEVMLAGEPGSPLAGLTLVRLTSATWVTGATLRLGPTQRLGHSRG